MNRVFSFFGKAIASSRTISGRSGFARLYSEFDTAHTAIDPYSGSNMWFANETSYFRMFCGVACRTQHFNVLTVERLRSINASGNLVVSVQVFGASAAFAFADFLYRALRQIVFCGGALGGATFPSGMIFSRRTGKRSRTFERAKKHLVSAMLAPMEILSTQYARGCDSFARQSAANEARTHQRASGGFASLMSQWSVIGCAASSTSQSGCHG